MSSKKHAWAGFFPIWLKFCGVSDEFEMLKSKWIYFSKCKFSALPAITDTFQKIDSLINETNQKFKPLFDREKTDKFKKFDENVAKEKLRDVEGALGELALHIGALKFVFFQRTVSNEIPHVISGIPASPEKTVGNEAIYIAADNVAKRYYESLRLNSTLSWDGVISFIYPMQGNYIGGVNRPSGYTKKIHVSLTEQSKNFLGSYLILAHEFGHFVHYYLRGNWNSFPQWSKLIWSDLFYTREYRPETIFNEQIDDLQHGCANCYIFKLLMSYLRDREKSIIQFEQYIADLIAILIGGPATCLAYTDILNTLTYLKSDPMRLAFLGGFLQNRGYTNESNLINSEFAYMKNNWNYHIQNNAEEFRVRCIDREELPNECFELYKAIGMYSGNLFGRYDTLLFDTNSIQSLELPIQDNEQGNFDSIISCLIKEKFLIDKKTETRIRRKLQEKQTCQDEDPKHILHCYYALHREGKAPDYSTTLFSLAFQKKKE